MSDTLKNVLALTLSDKSSCNAVLDESKKTP